MMVKKLRRFSLLTLFFILIVLILISFVEAPALIDNSQWGWNLTGIRYGSLAYGDLDRDNRSDLVLSGCLSSGGTSCNSGAITKIYTNNGSSLNENSSWQYNLTGVGWSSINLGDIDNNGLLDIIVTGCLSAEDSCSGGAIAKIYTNNGSSLNENMSWQQNLTGVWQGSAALGDINNDGWLDFIVTGKKADSSTFIKVYINNGTSLNENQIWQHNLTGVYNGNMVLADIDIDGNLDLILSGRDSSLNDHADIFFNNGTSYNRAEQWDTNLQHATYSSLIIGDWNNDGWIDLVLNGIGDYLRIYANNKTTFLENQTNEDGILAGTYQGSIGFGDYDNDGDLDLAALGLEDNRNRIYFNNYTKFFEDIIAQNNITRDIIKGPLLWVDIDDDTDLDLFMVGSAIAAGTLVNKVYISNQTLNKSNDKPYTSSTFDNHSLANGDIFIGWGDASDNETISLGLYYNLRVGTTSGGNQIVSGVFGGSSGGGGGGGGANGYFGNMMQRRNISLAGSRFSVGTTYFWSVQTIDTGLAKSAWSAEQTFTLTSDFTPPVVTLNAPSGVTNQTLNIVFNASVYDDYNLTNVSLYGNWSGGWHVNQTNSSGINNTDYIFRANLTEGEWLWGIRACDATNNCRGVNGTFRIDITYPIVALVSPANGTSQTSSNAVTFTYNVSDIAVNNCTLYLNGAANETDTSITVSTSQTFAENVPNGAYNWSIRCADAANNINASANFSLTVSYTPDTTPPSTSSGGGGGGGGSAVSAAITKVTRIIAAIVEGNNLIEFAESEKASVGVEEIMLDSATAASNVKITIEKLAAIPASISASPSGEVYTYLQFNKTVLKDEDVKQAKITFSVAKAWVARNGYDYKKVSLQRYTTKWTALSTAYLKQNASNYYYQAVTPGFSVFAITAEKKEIPAIEKQEENITRKKEESFAQETQKQEGEKKIEKKVAWLWYALIVLLAAALIVIAIIKGKKSHRK